MIVYIEVPGGHFSLKDARTVLPNVMANLIVISNFDFCKVKATIFSIQCLCLRPSINCILHR